MNQGVTLLIQVSACISERCDYTGNQEEESLCERMEKNDKQEWVGSGSNETSHR